MPREDIDNGFVVRNEFRKTRPRKELKFSRGYQVCKDRIDRNPKFNRSCLNCDSYYQAVGDKQECCQDTSVLEYDMITENNNIYCAHWKPCKKSTTLFKKKSGRSLLD